MLFFWHQNQRPPTLNFGVKINGNQLIVAPNLNIHLMYHYIKQAKKVIEQRLSLINTYKHNKNSNSETISPHYMNFPPHSYKNTFQFTVVVFAYQLISIPGLFMQWISYFLFQPIAWLFLENLVSKDLGFGRKAPE